MCPLVTLEGGASLPLYITARNMYQRAVYSGYRVPGMTPLSDAQLASGLDTSELNELVTDNLRWAHTHSPQFTVRIAHRYCTNSRQTDFLTGTCLWQAHHPMQPVSAPNHVRPLLTPLHDAPPCVCRVYVCVACAAAVRTQTLNRVDRRTADTASHRTHAAARFRVYSVLRVSIVRRRSLLVAVSRSAFSVVHW